MKIIMVNKFLYPRGGAETYVLKLGELFQREGHQVEYFGMYDEKNTVGNSLNLTTANMDFRKRSLKTLLYPLHIIYSMEARRKLVRLIEKFQPDIIHLNNINFQLTPSVIDAGAQKNVPMVQTVHDYQMVCPNHMLLDLLSLTPCEKCVNGSAFHCAFGSCIHGSRAKSIIGSLECLLYRIKNNYKKIDQYICPSYFIEKMLNRRTIYQNKTKVMHNFIDTDLPEPSSKKDYVLYFGRLSMEKGIDLLLDVCRKLPDIPFVIAGSGPMEAECIGCGLDNVTFVGFKNGEALKTMIAQASFSVYLPIWYENCPLSVLESQQYGTPVFASRIGGIPELIIDGEDGRLIDLRGADSCSRELNALWQDKEGLSMMQQNCFNKRKDMVTLDIYAKQLLHVYEDCIHKGSK